MDPPLAATGDTAPTDAAPGPVRATRSWRATAVTVAVATVAFGAALAGGLALRGEPEAGFDPTARLAFVSACASSAGDVPGGVCECAWEAVSTTMDYARYETLAAELIRPANPGSTRLGGPTDTATVTEASLRQFSALPADLRDPVRICLERARTAPRSPATQLEGGVDPSVPSPGPSGGD